MISSLSDWYFIFKIELCSHVDDQIHWTILELAPTDVKRLRFEYMNYPAFFMMCFRIHGAMLAASQSWSEVVAHLDSLLMPGHRGSLLIDDDQFSLSQRFFWAINLIEESAPMIENAIEHWDQYRKNHKLDNVGDRLEVISNGPVIVSKSAIEERFKRLLQQIEEAKATLKRLKKRFELLHSRADSLRAGVSLFFSRYFMVFWIPN